MLRMTDKTRKVQFKKADGNIFEDITWPSTLLLCPSIEFIEIFDFI